jgi:PAS domain-containing protein
VARYGVALAGVAAALLMRWALTPLLHDRLPYLTLFGGIALAVWLGRWKPAVLGAVVGFPVSKYFFGNSGHAFVLDFALVVELLGFCFSAGLIIWFGEAMHRARDRETLQATLLSVTLRSIADAVIATDEEGRCTFMNAEAERLTGWSGAEGQGKP